MRLDREGKFIKKYNTDELKVIFVAGERCDPKTVMWLHQQFPKAIINDNWWQTETGWPMGSNILDSKNFGPVFPSLPGSVSKVIPGWDIRILDENSNELDRNTLG
jgi:propionyl-CoA synthetase